MLVLLDTSHDLTTAESELGCAVGQLLTPLTRYRLREPDRPWAIDNGAYSSFDEKAFFALLKREEHHKENALFVCAPDVVGSAVRTLELFDHYRPMLAGWRAALVAQDGQESHRIPWPEIDAIFIGGSTSWKLSAHAEQICRVGKQLGKWVHIGRVNTPQRFKWAEQFADSLDGTGLSRYSWMRENIARPQMQEQMFERVG